MSNQELFRSFVDKSGLADEDLARLLEEKKRSLGYLINDDVALRLLAKEMGISLSEDQVEMPSLKIEDLIPGLNNVSLKARVAKVGEIKQFVRKDGKVGKVARIRISDGTGFGSLVLWDEKTEILSEIREGATISIHSAYTKSGLNGIELHLGQKGSIESVCNGEVVFKGIILRTYDPIEYATSDGRHGRVVAFIAKGEPDSRILVWNPSEHFISELKEGRIFEIIGGVVKKDFNGCQEIHVNDEKNLKMGIDTCKVPTLKPKRLFEITGEEKDLVIEGIIESGPYFNVTGTGKQYARVLLRDQDTVLPVVFWNDKAAKINKTAKQGMFLRVEGCTSRFGRECLEILVDRWSKIILRC